MEQEDIKGWVNTDPDTEQWGRQLSEYEFEFMEPGPGDITKHAIIDIRDYAVEEIECCINSYGYTLGWQRGAIRNIYELYKEETAWIVAECIFEQENGMY